MIKPKWDSKSVGEYERSLKPKVEDDDDIQTYKKPWVGLTDEERRHARETVTYRQLAMTAAEWTEEVQKETERRLKEKNA